VFDKAHPAHVRREVIDFDRAFDGANRVAVLAQVHAKALHARHTLVPLAQWLTVDGADPPESQVVEAAGQRSANETASAGD